MTPAERHDAAERSPWFSLSFTIVAIVGLALLMAACSWFGLFPLGGGGQVNNVFSNISNGLSQ